MDFCHSDETQSENKRKQKNRQILGFCQRIKKMWNTWVTAILFVYLEQSPKAYKGDLGKWEIQGKKSRPTKLQHCWNWPEYWEQSWKPEETCYHLVSSERTPVNTCVKNSQGVKYEAHFNTLCLKLIGHLSDRNNSGIHSFFLCTHKDQKA